MYPLDIAKVTAALGGVRALGCDPHSVAELSDAIADGLPRAVVAELAAQAAPDRADLRRNVAALIVSPATYKRNPRLSPAAGERAERLARITALAQQSLGDANEAREWLSTPHALLAYRTPIETATTDLGARLVERILINIEYALPV
jgi:putative toxin-antitoxin system antitoxin component (TIGR02293 family)